MSKPSKPNKHTHYRLGEPSQSGWYATKWIHGKADAEEVKRNIRRFWCGNKKTWSLPVNVGLDCDAIANIVKNQPSYIAKTDCILFSGLRVKP